jgi:EAL domain-containing protein (putative c-di-GMP-specific phosphodiesterase class I)
MGRELLVLDDDELVGAYIRRVAESIGLPCRTVATAAAFIERVDAHAPTDIVLDLQLGAADGVEMLRALAARNSKARIILLSGFDPRVLASARDLGLELGLDIRHALAKPVRAPAMKAALQLDDDGSGAVSAAELERAISRGELALEYQPIVGCREREVQSLEALCRWRRGAEPSSPGAFVPIAEADAELMDLLTMDVAERAARDWRTLAVSGRRTCISVNVSAQSLRRLDFPERLASLVERSGAPASGMKLEVTETAAMSEPQVTLDVLLRLRLKGFALSIDDFGAGFTSIAMLRRLPYSELKIDRSFIEAVDRSEDALAVARGIVALGRSMGMRTVAEGVETAEQLALVAELGADAAQGYLFSRPLPLDRLLVWLAERGTSAAAVSERHA